MQVSDLDDMLKLCAEQYAWSRKVYLRALALQSSSNPMLRVRPLFDPGTYADGEIATKPYAPFLDGIWVSYNKSDALGVTIQPRPARLAPDEDASDFVLCVSGEGAPDWLALEVALAWDLVREAGTVIAALFMSADRDTNIRLQMFCHDTEGRRHELIGNWAAVPASQTYGVARIDRACKLPGGVALDVSRPPVLAIFFDPDVREVWVSDLSIELV